MQPLKALSNTQKARLIHALFFNEIPDFLEFLEAQCLIIEENSEEIKREWKQNLLTADIWLGLSEETARVLKKFGKGLRSSSSVFSDQLFFGYGAIFLNHQLQQYVENNRHTDPKFKTAIDLFINP
ncbi:MAG TPA: hypothetical protein DCO83_07370 [Mucilaginibacter sp.]|jgi:hypothetical protein|nr:hypothetical protein [Mucilaginibacter sp.]